MKIRSCFVANSSSASFIVYKSHLTKEQIDAIWDHINYSKENNLDCYSTDLNDEWNILENDDIIGGETTMANFEMFNFLKLIGIDRDKVETEEQYEYDISNRLRSIQDEQEAKIYAEMKTRPIEREVELPFVLREIAIVSYLFCDCPVCGKQLRIYPDDIDGELFDVKVGFVIHCRECHRFFRLLDKTDVWKWGLVEKGNERFTMDKTHLFTKELEEALQKRRDER